MRAIILAAGRGSRMASLTDDRPKCLVEWRGRPLLDWQIEALTGAGAEEIGIVTGYRRDLLIGRGLREFHNPRWAETNMVSSLECAAEWLESGTCLVSYSDITYSTSSARRLAASPDCFAITYDPNWLVQWQKRFDNPLDDAETFRLDAEGYVADIGSRPSSLADVEGQYMGLLLFTPTAWASMQAMRAKLEPEERDRMHMTGAIQRALSEGLLRPAAIPVTDPWFEVDSPEDLRHLNEM